MTESTASLLIVNFPAMQVGMMQFLASERRRTQDVARLSAGIDGRRWTGLVVVGLV
jgi:hypothetical protein